MIKCYIIGCIEGIHPGHTSQHFYHHKQKQHGYPPIVEKTRINERLLRPRVQVGWVGPSSIFPLLFFFFSFFWSLTLTLFAVVLLSRTGNEMGKGERWRKKAYGWALPGCGGKGGGGQRRQPRFVLPLHPPPLLLFFLFYFSFFSSSFPLPLFQVPFMIFFSLSRWNDFFTFIKGSETTSFFFPYKPIQNRGRLDSLIAEFEVDSRLGNFSINDYPSLS